MLRAKPIHGDEGYVTVNQEQRLTSAVKGPVGPLGFLATSSDESGAILRDSFLSLLLLFFEIHFRIVALICETIDDIATADEQK